MEYEFDVQDCTNTVNLNCDQAEVNSIATTKDAILALLSNNTLVSFDYKGQLLAEKKIGAQVTAVSTHVDYFCVVSDSKLKILDSVLRLEKTFDLTDQPYCLALDKHWNEGNLEIMYATAANKLVLMTQGLFFNENKALYKEKARISKILLKDNVVFWSNLGLLKVFSFKSNKILFRRQFEGGEVKFNLFSKQLIISAEKSIEVYSTVNYSIILKLSAPGTVFTVWPNSKNDKILALVQFPRDKLSIWQLNTVTQAKKTFELNLPNPIKPHLDSKGRRLLFYSPSRILKLMIVPEPQLFLRRLEKGEFDSLLFTKSLNSLKEHEILSCFHRLTDLTNEKALQQVIEAAKTLKVKQLMLKRLVLTGKLGSLFSSFSSIFGKLPVDLTASLFEYLIANKQYNQLYELMDSVHNYILLQIYEKVKISLADKAGKGSEIVWTFLRQSQNAQDCVDYLVETNQEEKAILWLKEVRKEQFILKSPKLIAWLDSEALVYYMKTYLDKENCKNEVDTVLNAVSAGNVLPAMRVFWSMKVTLPDEIVLNCVES